MSISILERVTGSIIAGVIMSKRYIGCALLVIIMIALNCGPGDSVAPDEPPTVTEIEFGSGWDPAVEEILNPAFTFNWGIKTVYYRIVFDSELKDYENKIKKIWELPNSQSLATVSFFQGTSTIIRGEIHYQRMSR